MVDSENILKYIQQRGKDISLEEIEDMIEKEDRNKMIETETKRFRYEIWDKKSPINGITAKAVIKSRNYSIGQAYLIYIDNELVYFQDHDPNKTGYVKMKKKQAQKIAEDFIQQKIELNVDSIITQRVIEKILSER